MKNKKNPSLKYYILGTIVLFIGIIMLVVSLTLPLINKDLTYLNYIALGGVIISCPILFYAMYLLKKGNFLKLNKHLKDDNKDK